MPDKYLDDEDNVICSQNDSYKMTNDENVRWIRTELPEYKLIIFKTKYT